MDMDFEVLCVSQFTLQCVLKGNKPDFHQAMPAELAQPFYNDILENMRIAYKPERIKGGWTGYWYGPVALYSRAYPYTLMSLLILKCHCENCVKNCFL